MPLRFDKALCTGCKICQLACSAHHEQVFNPEKSRIRISHAYQRDGIRIASRYCIFCKKCEKVCPELAISNDGSRMIVEKQKCSGCGACVEKCPTNAVFLDENNKALICDLCGGSPKCVEWCPKQAIFFKQKRAG